MKIAVKTRQYGFFSTDPVTVYRMDDSGIVWCNHDGYQEEDYVGEMIGRDDNIRRWYEKHEVCDKCYAWRRKGEDNWNDEPAEQPVRF